MGEPNMTTFTPLGTVVLENSAISIYPMNDLFMSYTYDDEENWEALKTIVNTFIGEYRRKNPKTVLDLIKGDIVVETQYKYLLDKPDKSRRQDIRIVESDKNVTYVEFQIKAKTEPLIEIRAFEYFTLGIRHKEGKTADQIWLLAENADSVLQGESIINYVTKSETDDKVYPSTSSMLFVSLQRLADEEGAVGELASLLLGRPTNPKDRDIEQVLRVINNSFTSFKGDKEVRKVLTFEERKINEGRVLERENIEKELEEIRYVERQEGKQEGAREILDLVSNELIKKGIDPSSIESMVHQTISLQ
jgi:hypothetical protein